MTRTPTPVDRADISPEQMVHLLVLRAQVREAKARVSAHLAHKERQECLHNLREEVESWRAPDLYWYWLTAPKELQVRLSSARHAQAALGVH